MAHWSKRTFPNDRIHEWMAVQQAFEQAYMATSPTHWKPDQRGEMMLLRTRAKGGYDTLYMALPDGMPCFDGFEPTDFHDIPPNPDLLVADQIGYDQLFRS